MTEAADRQRIDKWLWFVRLAPDRNIAQALATGGKLRINGRKIDQASAPVRPGDVLTISYAGRVRIIRVLGFAERRGPYAAMSKLYEDITAPADAAGQADGDH